ncbi:MAG: rod shape-determining protein RodA [Ignavibacterium album]|uniref:rod shape-determining protein RodA n=1 Tax=Ignavibacterium album TaxID=591197 RepID=UPI0026EBF161|nr:rod shape-determining protein RodA [Ignavibacterium album]MBI5663051.1 rod shape-determining protein RodA [Ignavibacterium album]
MRIDYKISDKFDFKIFIPVLILTIIGLAAVYSSTLNNPQATDNFERQLLFTLVAYVVFFITYALPTNTFKLISGPSYIFALLLLVVVLIAGKRVSGAKSWLAFGSIGFQPSEFAKIATILLLANFLTRLNNNIDSFKDILISLMIGFIPVGLIMLEPDMGTSFIFISFILIILFWKGISLLGLFVVLSPGFVAIASLFGSVPFIASLVVVLVVLFFFKRDLFFNGSVFAINLAAGFFTDNLYNALSPHQQARIKSFIDPMSDPLGSGYNSIQAMVAIGSGGLFGKGYLQGNQTQLQYIPEQWTDFIYCAIGEEFGFIGAMTVLSLFLIIFIRLLNIASTSKDEFLSIVVIGIFGVYFTHFLINVGMVIGILPIIGVPLPFVSYGGSSMLLNMFMLGIVLNIFRTRKNYA